MESTCLCSDCSMVLFQYSSMLVHFSSRLGSRHFLARYGYLHRRTEGDRFVGNDKDINVLQSINFVFSKNDEVVKSDEECNGKGHKCRICMSEFDGKKELDDHLASPALPDIVTGVYESTSDTVIRAKAKKLDKTSSDSNIASEPPPVEPIDFKDATILIEGTVGEEFADSKRLKWLCRQQNFALSKFIRSKSQCEDAIKNGRVFVNRCVVMDSSRIVRENDVITLVEEYALVSTSTNNINANDNDSNSSEKVKVVKELLINKDVTLVVVHKPVGMRCVGSFSHTTLEMITKRQYETIRGVNGLSCNVISKLDTGSAGLCLLTVSSSTVDNGILDSVKAVYTFTVLVHGCPENWKSGVYSKVPSSSNRLWKRQKNGSDNGVDETSDPIATTSEKLCLDDALFIQCLDTQQIPTDDGEHHNKISTLTVQSSHDDGRLANTISYVLRKLGYPVVNDRFAKREGSSLPRRMRNLMKQKVCIGCYRVDIQLNESISTVEVASHNRTQCKYWRDVLGLQSGTRPT
eukprot:g12069.t1.1.5e17418b g12069  g12069.t1 contig6:1154214-1155773(-)